MGKLSEKAGKLVLLKEYCFVPRRFYDECWGLGLPNVTSL